MDLNKMKKILEDNAYIRTGGSPEERKCAEYIQGVCAEMGLQAHLEAFPVELATIHKAELWIDGEQIPCTGYAQSGSGEVEAPIYYLTNSDPYALSQCKGKIVFTDGGMGYWHYTDILEAGAVGFITYNGNASNEDPDIEQKELRAYVRDGRKALLGANIHVKTAIDLVNKGMKTGKIVLEQDMYEGPSHNVVLDLPGEIPEWITFTAHYDSTPTSIGVWDNMSGSVGLLAIAEYFASHPHRYGLRFIWCGSEERGLLGAKAYCEAHADELKDIALEINLDMIGCIMGKHLSICTAEEKLVHYIQYLADERGYSLNATQGIHSSDSTPFADKGIPTASFAHSAPGHTATIHNRYDTMAVMKMEHMQEDIDFIIAFTDRMANAQRCPVSRTIPDNMKVKLDEYLNRKRPS